MNIPLSYQDTISSVILVRLHFVSNRFRFFGEFKAVSQYRKENIFKPGKGTEIQLLIMSET